jgi:hypothetical protein
MRYACRIECVSASGRFSGTDGDGRSWSLSRDELIQAVEAGQMTCYVTIDGHSHLVTVRTDERGGRTLFTFMGALEVLPLPTCS